jgi:N-acetylglucosamine kinase-like BadF-type ATPase
MLDKGALGKKIKALRRERGLTQSAFADELHVSFQAVSNWERGIVPPDIDNLINIAECFGVLVDELIRPQSDFLFLGIDGGGTKTEFAISAADGHVLKHFTSGGSNPNDIGFEKSYEIIKGGIDAALIEFPTIRAVFCGVAGMASGNYAARMVEQLQARYPSMSIKVYNDSSNLFAMDEQCDMVLICGAGAVVYAKKGDEYIRIGGWGYLFGEPGSAYSIGRDAIMLALSEEDALEKPSLISRLLLKKLDTPTVWSSIDSIYKGGRSFVASLAYTVFDAYREGDSKAIAIIEKNVKHLAELLNCGIHKHNARPMAIASGGIFERYEDILHSEIVKYTDAKIVTSKLPPIYGACRQAVGLLKDEIPNEFYENFKRSYNGK